MGIIRRKCERQTRRMAKLAAQIVNDQDIVNTTTRITLSYLVTFGSGLLASD